MTFDSSPHIGIDARMYSESFTGIGRYTHELTRNLFQLRPEWRFTLFLGPDAFDEFTPVSKNVAKVLAPERHYSLSEQNSFLFKIRQQNFDLFHFPHFNAPLLYRRKCIVTIHDLTISFFPGKKKTTWLHKLGYKMVLSSVVKRAARVITVSEHTKKDLQEILGTPEEKIQVIWNGLGTEFRQDKQDRKKLQDVWKALNRKHHISEPYFLYAGVHREHKNVVGMIRAFAEFLRRGNDAQLLITGKEDPFYPEIPRTIAKLGLEEKIKRVGLVSEAELKALYFHAHVFVLPSFYEGFGFPPLEAMAMEIPVVCSRIAALPEICGDAVEYFNPYNTEEMAAKMEKVFRNEKVRKELVEKGKKRIRLFSWKKMAEETLEVYEEVLNQTKN